MIFNYFLLLKNHFNEMVQLIPSDSYTTACMLLATPIKQEAQFLRSAAASWQLPYAYYEVATV